MAGVPRPTQLVCLLPPTRGEAVSQANDPQMETADLVRWWVQEIFNDRNLSAADDLMADTYSSTVWRRLVRRSRGR
jgi:hypothetical protein